MSTYLQIVNDTILESGADLDTFAEDGSDFNIMGHDSLMYKFKNWVARAWQTIQQNAYDWGFMSEQAVVNINPGIMFYSPHTISWTFDKANPFIIYDTDDTATVTGYTVTDLTVLTGKYTNLENFGIVDLQCSAGAPIAFGMKAGGEYFKVGGSGPGEPLVRISHVSVGISSCEFPPDLTPHTSGLFPTSQFTFAKCSIFQYSYDSFNERWDFELLTDVNTSGVYTPDDSETGLISFESGANDFIEAWHASLSETDSSIAVIFYDSSNTQKAVLAAAYSQLEDSGMLYGYDTGFMFNTVSYTIVSDIGYEIGGPLHAGDVLTRVHSNYDTLATDSLVIENVVSTTAPFEAVFNQDITYDNVPPLNRGSLFQMFYLSNRREGSTEYIEVTDASASNGFYFSVLSSGDSQGSIAVTINEPAPPTDTIKNYIHSWKSFDWGEELDDDDFVEDVAEIDEQSFRLVTHEMPAPGMEIKLPFLHWEIFRTRYNNATVPPSQPRVITKDNTGRWRTYPAPDMPYTLLFDYVRKPQKLTAYTDVPKNLPEDYMDIVMWRALIYYGEYDEQPSVVTRATRNYKDLLSRMELLFRDKFHFSPVRLW